MRIGISIPNFGEFGDPAAVIDLAVTAERVGFDGFFLWDHIVIANGVDVADPWVMLGAMAQATERIMLGPMVTPIPRRRPWVLARQATSVDRLSGGRLILGVGLGAPAAEEFGTFGEPESEQTRAELLDEGLDVLAGMWSGEPFAFSGRRYEVAETVFGPRPVRSSGIPVWVAGMWPNRPPFRRAARYDGVAPIRADMAPMGSEELAEVVAYVEQHRAELGAAEEPFDVAVGSPPDPDTIAALGRAGATWVMIGPDFGAGVADVKAMIEAGVPR
jgi:alkanesulfonate monooxygenase SsuD/methylene tetrahydromethanopterin reductase-like flavin-dependent oxidoreductase (luciferase family)